MDKNIDESWKEAVDKEKAKENSASKESAQTLEANFNTLVSSMAMEALIFPSMV